MTSEFHQFKLRIPVILMDQIEANAAASGRSLSAEILFRLQEAYRLESEMDDIEVAASQTALNLERLEKMNREVTKGAAAIERGIAEVEALKAKLEHKLGIETSQGKVGRKR